MLKLFQVVEKGEIHYFTLKAQAKEKRDELIEKGQTKAKVSYGPEHNKHPNNRKEPSWNKGRHPKKGHKGGKKSIFQK